MNNIDELKQQLAEIQAKIEKLEKKEHWEMKCPFEDGCKYYAIDVDGSIDQFECEDSEKMYWETEVYLQGNIFFSEKAAELESKRRNLLTRFRAFRDECNGDWKPDWNDNHELKFYLCSVLDDGERYIQPLCQGSGSHHVFPLFGVFKTKKDAQRAIKLFGDEIIELFMEAE